MRDDSALESQLAWFGDLTPMAGTRIQQDMADGSGSSARRNARHSGRQTGRARAREPKRARRASGDLFSLNQQDAVEWLGSLPEASVDLIITDPPYESLEKHRAIGTTTRLKHSKASSNDWFQIFPNERFPALFSQMYRVLKKNSHLYLFCDQETLFVAKPAAEAAGFRFWKPLVWDKQKIGMGYHYRSRYEFVLFFEKGKRKLNDLGIADVIECARVFRGYPTEKPVGVSEVLVRQSSEPGQVVIDPFLGSGSVGVAALGQGRCFQGNDICTEALEISRQRLKQAAHSFPTGTSEAQAHP